MKLRNVTAVIQDAERVENAVKQTTAEVIPNCGYFTKDELRKAIKKRFVQFETNI